MILIKNLEMPKCCEDCFALDDYYNTYLMCKISCQKVGYRFQSKKFKMSQCPLVEVKLENGKFIMPSQKPYWIKGKFIDDDFRYNDRSYKCSNCGHITNYPEKICPSCGKEMQE